MARGQPDFGMYAPKTTTASLADMAELAVRLGSIVSYDRRGDVIYLDDFEAAVIKFIISVSAGGAIVLDSTSVRSGFQAVKFTTAAAALNSALLRKWLSVVGSRRLGAEFHFSYPADTYTLSLSLAYYSSTTLYYGEVRLDFTDNTLKIIDGDGNWNTIAENLSLAKYYHQFTGLKLVADFSTNKYVRLLLGNTEYDVSAYSLETAASALKEGLGVFTQVFNDDTGTAASLWIDDLIVTQNEP